MPITTALVHNLTSIHGTVLRCTVHASAFQNIIPFLWYSFFLFVSIFLLFLSFQFSYFSFLIYIFIVVFSSLYIDFHRDIYDIYSIYFYQTSCTSHAILFLLIISIFYNYFIVVVHRTVIPPTFFLGFYTNTSMMNFIFLILILYWFNVDDVIDMILI